MKRKLLSWLLMIAMLLNYMPMTAFALNDSQPTTTQSTSAVATAVTTGGAVNVTPSAIDVTIWARDKQQKIDERWDERYGVAESEAMTNYLDIVAYVQSGGQLNQATLDYIKKTHVTDDYTFQKGSYPNYYKVVDYAKAILMIRAAGYDPTDYYKLDFVAELDDFSTYLGLSTETCAIIVMAYGCDDFTTTNEDKWLEKLIAKQADDGSFGTVQETAMALYALSSYDAHHQAAKNAVDKAITYISARLTNQADINDVPGDGEALAWLAGALFSVDPNLVNDDRLTKGKQTLLHALNQYDVADTSTFSATTDSQKSDEATTIKAFYALTAYRYDTGGLLTLKNIAKKPPIEISPFKFDAATATIKGYIGTIPKDLVIPSQIDGVAVKHIGNSAFKYSTYSSKIDKPLNSVILPEGLETIEYMAFQGNNLTNLIIPASVTTINNGFRLNRQLKAVKFAAGSKLETLGKDAFYGCALESITLPEGLVTIGERALADNDLKAITIPNTVKTIEDSAFMLNAIEIATMPSTVEAVGKKLFYRNFSEYTKNNYGRKTGTLRLTKVYTEKDDVTNYQACGVVNPVAVAVVYKDGEGNVLKEQTVVGKNNRIPVMVPGKYFDVLSVEDGNGSYIANYLTPTKETAFYTKKTIFNDVIANYFLAGNTFTFTPENIDGYQKPDSQTITISKDQTVIFVYKSLGDALLSVESEGIKTDPTPGEYGKGKVVNVTILPPKNKQLMTFTVNGSDKTADLEKHVATYSYQFDLIEDTKLSATYNDVSYDKEIELTADKTEFKLGQSAQLMLKYRDQVVAFPNHDFYFEQSPKDILVIDDNLGEVTATGSGTVTLTAILRSDSTVKDLIEITVKPAKATVVAAAYDENKNTGIDHEFIVLRQVVTVEAGFAKKYGYTNKRIEAHALAGEVTMFDVLVKLNIEFNEKLYSDWGMPIDITPDNFSAYKDTLLVIGDGGFVTKNFMYNSASQCMFVNDRQPHGDKWFIENVEYLGYSVDDMVVVDGDDLLFGFYSSDTYSDSLTWFEKDGQKVTDLTVTVNEAFDLTLMGYMASAGLRTEKTIQSLTSAQTNYPIALIDESGKMTEITGLKSDADGKFTHSFDKVGKYVLGAKSNGVPIFSPYLVINVKPSNVQQSVLDKFTATKTDYDTFYYTVDEADAYTYQGNAVTLPIDAIKSKKISYTITAGNDAIINPGEEVTITFDTLDTPVGLVSGKWNSTYAGLVNVVYSSDMPGLAKVENKGKDRINQTLTFTAPAVGTYTLSGGHIFEKANQWSPGIDFGDGVVTERDFSRLPDISLVVLPKQDVPPNIDVQTLTDGQVFTKKNQQVTIMAKDNAGNGIIPVVTLNDIALIGEQNTYQLSLTEGQNTLKIVATDDQNRVSELLFTLYYNKGESSELDDFSDSKTAYDTFYYTADEVNAFSYQGNAVTLPIDDIKSKKISYTITAGNDAIINPGEEVTITFDTLDAPVGLVSGKWNSTYAGLVNVVYSSDMPGLAKVENKGKDRINQTLTFTAPAVGTYTLSGGHIFEKANQWSPGIDFGDGNGVVNERYFDRLPTIIIEVVSDEYQVADSSIPADFTNDLWLNTNYRILEVGETYTLKARRVPEIIDNPISNNVKHPPYSYEVIEGDSVRVADTSSSVVAITALKPGTSIIKVGYGDTTAYGKDYGAVSRVNYSYFIVNVVNDKQTSITLDTDIAVRSYDTIYYKDGDTVDYTFSVSTNGDRFTATCNGQNAVIEDSQVTVNLENRSNIIAVTAYKGDKSYSLYYVIDARKIKLTVENLTHPNKEICVGDEVKVSFTGVTMPVYKLATIYNPTWYNPDGPWGATYGTTVRYSNAELGELISYDNVQYGLAKHNAIKFTAGEAKTYRFNNGYIDCEWWGSALGSDKDLSGPGNPNLNAPTLHGKFSKLPDFSVAVKSADDSEIKPTITIAGIEDKQRFTDSDVEVKITAQDSEGNAITPSVTLNDKPVENKDDIYKLNFVKEQNTLKVIAKDSAGVLAERTLTLLYTAVVNPEEPADPTEPQNPNQPESDRVVISVDKLMIDKGYALEKTTVELKKGDTVWDVLNRVLTAKNIDFDYTFSKQYNSVYISSIDGDGEFDHGAGSGWMYAVNDNFPQVGASLYELENGDVIKWRYTTNYGKDIGSDVAGGNSKLREQLAEKIAIAKKYKQDNYTKASFKALQAAVKKAEQLINDKSDDTSTLLKAIDKLTEATKQLVKIGSTPNDQATNNTIDEKGNIVIEGQNIPLASATLTFADNANINGWARQSISEAVSLGMVQGDLMNRFNPRQNISRAELAQMVNPLIANWTPANNDVVFKDVAANAWYSVAVDDVVKRGVMLGMGDQFKPEVNLTREELAVTVMRYLSIGVDDITMPSDIDSASAWAKVAVTQVYSLGIMQGDGQKFNPKDQVTREMAVTILIRAHKLMLAQKN